MKFNTSLGLTAFGLFVLPFLGQAQSKKYVLLEHFTNTRCGVCASKNPGFYTTINQYPNDVHHISIHPSVPYANCALYLANPTENQARATFYNVQGTPQVYLNGVSVSINNQLGTNIASHQADLSPVSIKVENTGSGNARQGKITISTSEVLPAANYKLFVAEVEKTLNYAAPNGEQVHRDVFRNMWGGGSGLTFTLPSPGTPTVVEQDFTIQTGWNADEIYLLAFVQNMDTKEVLNSGSQFDPTVSSTQQLEKAEKMSVYPSPTTNLATINLQDDQMKGIEMYTLAGKRVVNQPTSLANTYELFVGDLSKGVYILKVTGEKGVYTQKLVKE